MKLKTCKVCKNKFEPTRPMMVVCSPLCAYEYAKKEKPKRVRKDKAEHRDNNMSLLKKKAQDAFNAYIRARDGKTCISCGYVGDKRQFHAGHYRPQGRNSSLRYDELNVHSQCSICNNHLSGNLVEYRANLIKKIGLNRVVELETNNALKKWTKEELNEIITTYRKKTKDLSNM